MRQPVGDEFHQAIGEAEQKQDAKKENETVSPNVLVDQFPLPRMKMSAQVEDQEVPFAEKVEYPVDIDKEMTAVVLLHRSPLGVPDNRAIIGVICKIFVNI